ncbi:unnamed protein product [Clonostachys solani]|uniref:Uncharacterized protein n=1 Tax=Clonostachys solani TaxID=160281 RepID=A0A9N9ZG03_9HYPO|nr:unnamed protein product [Clonostachys solani]
MTLVFNSPLGSLIQSQFGVNEIASSVLIGKTIGNVLSRDADTKTISNLAAGFRVNNRPIPKYLESVAFDRSGVLLGARQRRISVPNTLGGVYWLVTSPRLEPTEAGLPYATRELLRTFVQGVIDADRESQQWNKTRLLMAKLVAQVGDSAFLDSISAPSQTRIEELIHFLLGDLANQIQKSASELYPTFDTFSAGVAMVALAAASNGASIKVQCFKDKYHPIVLSEPPQSPVEPRGASVSMLQVNLWLTEPPPDIAERLRAIQNNEDAHPRIIIPIVGGISEVSMVVARELQGSEEPLEYWKLGLQAGRSLDWEVFGLDADAGPGFGCRITEESLVDKMGVQSFPNSLRRHAKKYLPHVSSADKRRRIIEKAASIYHKVMNYADYDDDDEKTLHLTLRFIILAIFVGAMEKLATNTTATLADYAWTCDLEQLNSFAEAAVSKGISSRDVIYCAARIWGGMTRSLPTEIARHQKVLGIVCPQVTILMNILSNADDIAKYGLDKGLFTLHRGSVPILPRHPETGLILAGEKRSRHKIAQVRSAPPSDLEISVQGLPDISKYVESAPVSDDGEAVVERLIFTVEPTTGDNGVMCALLCAWQHGEVILELNPYTTLFNLTHNRGLGLGREGKMTERIVEARSRDKVEYIPNLSFQGRPVVARVETPEIINNISPKHLLSFKGGFKVANGLSIVRVGSRTDLQIAAAGSISGTHTIMIADDESAQLIRDNQKLDEYNQPILCLNLEIRGGSKAFRFGGTAIIFGHDDLPSLLGPTN